MSGQLQNERTQSEDILGRGRAADFGHDGLVASLLQPRGDVGHILGVALGAVVVRAREL